jgi:hypothetical protein
MGRCERQVVFEQTHGVRQTPRREAARRRGLAAHAHFEREGRLAMKATRAARGRCFIATMVFGEAWQTQALRDFRDDVLRRRPWGRLLILAYYRVAPYLCTVLRAWPALQRPVRCGLELVIWLWLRRSSGCGHEPA